MRNCFTVLFLLFLANLLPAQDAPSVPYGTWEVILPPDSLAAPELIRSVQPYLGKKVIIRENRYKLFFRRTGNPPFQLKSGKCKQPDYQWELHDSEAIYRRTREQIVYFDRRDPDMLWFLSAECSDGRNSEAGAGFYLLDDDLLLLTYMGLVCYLRRK